MSAISNLIFNGANHYVTSPFGKRTSLKTDAGKTSSYHNGTDYGTNGKKIAQYAIEDGYVFAAQKASDGALYVWVIYPRIKKAFLHYHLDSIAVKAKQTVKKGTKLGNTGMTGKSTGVHLHLGIRDIAKLTTAQINSITWPTLQSCSYVDPEKVSYTPPTTTTTTKPTTVGFTRFDAEVTASVLNMRKGAGTNYGRVKYLYKGNTVIVIGEIGDWYKIAHGGQEGYCHKQYLKKKATVKYYSKYTDKSTNIDVVFEAIGVPAAYRGKWSNRKPVAKANGISAYIGSAKQNTTLIDKAKAGKLIKP